MRARWIVGAFVLGAAGLFAATRQRVIATTADGTVDVVSAEYGTEFELPQPRFAMFPALFPRWTIETTPSPVLAIQFFNRAQAIGVPSLVASCGCRFRPVVVHWPRNGCWLGFYHSFPRRAATQRLEIDDVANATAEFDSPAPIPPPATADGVGELPVVVRADGETWVLAADPQDARSVVVRAVGADRSGFEWTYRGAWFEDASGNRVSRQSDAFTTREHRITLPQTDDGALYRLCPHEPWWELTIDVTEAKSVTFRFRPPR